MVRNWGIILYSLDLQESLYNLWYFNAREACSLEGDQILDPKGRMQRKLVHLICETGLAVLLSSTSLFICLVICPVARKMKKRPLLYLPDDPWPS